MQYIITVSSRLHHLQRASMREKMFPCITWGRLMRTAPNSDPQGAGAPVGIVANSRTAQ